MSDSASVSEARIPETSLVSGSSTGKPGGVLSMTGSVAVRVRLGKAHARAVALLVVVALHVPEVVTAGEACRTLVESLGAGSEASLVASGGLAVASASKQTGPSVSASVAASVAASEATWVANSEATWVAS